MSEFTDLIKELCDGAELTVIDRAVLRRCKIAICDIVVYSLLNSSVLVADCERAAEYVCRVDLNEKGKVQFRRNTVKPTYFFNLNYDTSRHDECAVILPDEKSKVVKHEFQR